MEDCIFCKIVGGEIPSTRVYEDESMISFLDINPLSPGHTLMIPRNHYELITDMPGEEVAALMSMAPQIARAVVKAVGAEGFNIFQTNGACSGQVVPHVHFHIIPRHEGDGLGFIWKPQDYAEGEMERLRESIVGNLDL